MSSYLSRGDAIKRVGVRHVATFNSACEVCDLRPPMPNKGRDATSLNGHGCKLNFKLLERQLKKICIMKRS
jgi:hypothetical protein